jgi:hypothetical protein
MANLKCVGGGALVAVMAASGCARAADVVTYHNSNTRGGHYTVAGLTTTAASTLQLDSGFRASISGNVYAQPLYWAPGGGAPAELIVATENNIVYALNATTGATIWQRALPAAITSGLPCGNVNPDGITGTPVIDAATGTLYLNSETAVSGTAQHEIYALSLKTGAVLSGWPLNTQTLLAGAGVTFTPPQQGSRSALLLFQGALYVTYGGRYGDCGPYHGTVVQIDPATRALTGNWETRASGGGIWAQGGISSDGKYLFTTTGNTFNANNVWGDGEGIIRLLPGLTHQTASTDFYTPANWQTLDNDDADLGGTEALPLNVDTGTGSAAPKLIAFGKDGNAYLVNRANLGGIGGKAVITKVSNSVILTAPAVYNTSAATLVAFTNFNSVQCNGGSLQTLDLQAGAKSSIATKWCAGLNGGGSPMITTSDGTNNPIVWVLGAGGDNLLHGFNALNGAAVYNGTTTLSGLHYFQTLIAAGGRLYVAGDNSVYSFTFTP